MVERSEDLRFSAKAGDAFGVIRERNRQDFQGYVSTELRIFCPVDLL
jgi:hypothetical protein